MLCDIAIIGGGPAGLSAALTARQRNKSVILFEAKGFSPRLSKAHKVENYLGLPDVSGKEMLDVFLSHVKKHEPTIIEDKVTSIFPGEKDFTVVTEQVSYQASTVIFTVGEPPSSAFPGELDFLGRGVSYCGTCDGIFFQDKKVAVIASSKESDEETDFLAGVCSEVVYIPLFKGEYYQNDKVKIVQEVPEEILGNEVVTTLKTDKATHAVDGVFIFREDHPLESIIEGLEMEDDKFIKVDSHMRTNIPGVFAAGDCTGHPWQISKATGQGLVAALSAVSYLFSKK